MMAAARLGCFPGCRHPYACYKVIYRANNVKGSTWQEECAIPREHSACLLT